MSYSRKVVIFVLGLLLFLGIIAIIMSNKDKTGVDIEISDEKVPLQTKKEVPVN